MAIHQSLLQEKSASYRETLHEILMTTLSADPGVKSAFLCHSHDDEGLVKGLIVFLQEKGVRLYVDWMDQSMPASPNRETARKIQNAIKRRDLFLFLATANSKKSRWCPWEIGYADSSARRIYIISTADGLGTYGNEYLQLYPRLDLAEAKQASAGQTARGFAAFEPGNQQGRWFQDELRRL